MRVDIEGDIVGRTIGDRDEFACVSGVHPQYLSSVLDDVCDCTERVK
jgi:hypothetical protein